MLVGRHDVGRGSVARSTVSAVTRAVLIFLYALLAVIWSSTWVAIKFGLEDCPALLGAGIRFAAAGVLLIAIALVRRDSLKTDVRLGGDSGRVPVRADIRARVLG